MTEWQALNSRQSTSSYDRSSDICESSCDFNYDSSSDSCCDGAATQGKISDIEVEDNFYDIPTSGTSIQKKDTQDEATTMVKHLETRDDVLQIGVFDILLHSLAICHINN